MLPCRALLTALLASAVLSAPLAAQDPWDNALTLTGMRLGKAESSQLGQNQGWGAGMVGYYPSWRGGGMVFEAGYRALPSRTVSLEPGSAAWKMDGWYAGVWARFGSPQRFAEGAYFQVGMRGWQMMATETLKRPGGVGESAEVKTETRGPKTTSWKPGAALGYRFNERLSMEFAVLGFAAKNVQGQECKGTVLEVTLGMHL